MIFLQAIKLGVYDVLPNDALKGLTAEDLRLVLCGTHDISIRLLQSYTSFADESSAPADQLARFKRWFWSVVSKLNAHDRQVQIHYLLRFCYSYSAKPGFIMRLMTSCSVTPDSPRMCNKLEMPIVF